MKEKLILPITIILASLIIGGFYYFTQISKQDSVERQKEMDIKAKKMEIDANEKKALREEQIRKDCQKEAEDRATEVIKTRAEAFNQTDQDTLSAIENNLYRRDDFDKFYENCLSSYGLKK